MGCFTWGKMIILAFKQVFFASFFQEIILGPTMRARLDTIKFFSACLQSSHIDNYVCPFVCLLECPSKRDIKVLGTSFYTRS